MASFVAIELRHRRPLVRLGILRSGALLHANLCAAAMYGSYAAFQFLVTIYFARFLRVGRRWRWRLPSYREVPSFS